MSSEKIKTYDELDIGLGMIESGEAEQAIINEENK